MEFLKESFADFMSESKQYQASMGKAKIRVNASELTDDRLRDLVVKLNKAGFGLGSGHEELKLVKNGNLIVFKLVPYLGHVGQSLTFSPVNEEDPGVPSEEQGLGIQLATQVAGSTIAF